MNAKVIASYAGIFLLIVGVIMIAAQMVVAIIGHDPINEMSKSLDIDIHHIAAKMNVPGFGVLLVGAFLIAISLTGKQRAKRR